MLESPSLVILAVMMFWQEGKTTAEQKVPSGRPAVSLKKYESQENTLIFVCVNLATVCRSRLPGTQQEGGSSVSNPSLESSAFRYTVTAGDRC